MKKILPLLLVTSLLLSACSIDWNDEKDKEVIKLDKQIQNDIFNKKQECLKHINLLESTTEAVGKEYSSLGTFSFEQVFYSQKYNNCLWVRVHETEEKNTKINNTILPYTISIRNLYEVGTDSGTSKPLDSCSTSNINIDENINIHSCDAFDKNIKELKGE